MSKERKIKMTNILKTIALFLAVVGLLAVITQPSEATGYKKSYTVVQNKPNGWNILTYSHTFVGTTDTVYFPFTPNRPSANYLDTLIANITAKVTPANDTSNVAWEVWVTSDTTNWWVAASNKFDASIWSKTAVGRDSTASGTNFRVIPVGTATYKGWHPYIMLVGIGKDALPNGKGNEIGNVIKVDIIKP